MLKPLLLSGWFRAQPFLNYVVVVILIAPLLGASGHSAPVKSEVVKRTSITEESEPVSKEIALVGEPEIAETLTVDGVNSSAEEVDSVPTQSSAIQAPQVLPEYKDYKIESFAQLDSSLASSDLNVPDPLAEVELAPLTDVPVGQIKLVQKLKAAHIKSLKEEKNLFAQRKTFY